MASDTGSNVFTDIERKLIRLALDPGAAPGEIDTAAIKLVRSLRSRAIPSERIISLPTIRPDCGETRLPFGRHRHKQIRDVDFDYLKWFATNCYSQAPSVCLRIEQFLEREGVCEY
jgi:uncharacterized protein (DUF3820 family)